MRQQHTVSSVVRYLYTIFISYLVFPFPESSFLFHLFSSISQKKLLKQERVTKISTKKKRKGKNLSFPCVTWFSSIYFKVHVLETMIAVLFGNHLHRNLELNSHPKLSK